MSSFGSQGSSVPSAHLNFFSAGGAFPGVAFEAAVESVPSGAVAPGTAGEAPPIDAIAAA